MDEEIERLVVSVRADTAGFRRDVAAMRAELEGPLGTGAERAGRLVEGALARAVRTGKIEFEDLRRSALAALGDIAAQSIAGGLRQLVGGGGGGIGGGLVSALTGLLGGVPGRATGGPVAPGRAYRVGERGPELFVPTSSGTVVPTGATPAREVRIAITVNARGADAPAALQRSGRQVARAVKAALVQAED